MATGIPGVPLSYKPSSGVRCMEWSEFYWYESEDQPPAVLRCMCSYFLLKSTMITRVLLVNAKYMTNVKYVSTRVERKSFF